MDDNWQVFRALERRKRRFEMFVKSTGYNKPITFAKLVNGWKRIGIKPGDCIMVHSRMSSLGEIVGASGERASKTEAARIVIDSLFHCVGKEGTIVQPALSGTAHWLATDNPAWSTDKVITRFTIPEVFRQMEGTRRSMHPTHSVCAGGRLAENIIAGHIDTETPCGVSSPYGKLPELGAKILLIGVDLNSCTFIHHLEEKYGAPGHMAQGNKLRINILDNNIGVREFRYHLIDGMDGYMKKDFNRLMPFLTEREYMTEEMVEEARCYLITNLEMMDKITSDLLKGNPYFLVK